MCRVLSVSKSGFYDWRSRPESQRCKENGRLLDKLKKSFAQSQRTYGVRRLTEDLKELGEPVNHKRVARLKQENSIYPKQHKAFVVTTDSTHGQGVADNLLDRQFDVDNPNAVWVSDITSRSYLKGNMRVKSFQITFRIGFMINYECPYIDEVLH